MHEPSTHTSCRQTPGPQAIGAAGARALLDAVAARGKARRGGKVRVLTHCNTGSLATAAYGTALGVIRALHDAGALEHAYCTETRPYNQGGRWAGRRRGWGRGPARGGPAAGRHCWLWGGGRQVGCRRPRPAHTMAEVARSQRAAPPTFPAQPPGARLTAFELVHDGLPATLICDSAAAALMGRGDVDAVVVGADRVVANGDTANKIGTYALGIAAAHHRLPFFVAAPTTTLDAGLADGSAIEIEQRPPEEITHFRGTRVAAEGIGIWNPCFDVVPGTLVEGIVTEKGVVPRDPESGGHAVRAFMSALGLWPPAAANGGAGAGGSDGKQQQRHAPESEWQAAQEHDGATVVGRPLGEEGVRAYVAARPALCEKVGPADSAADWRVEVRADGNINFVYLVTGPTGGLCVKESLPYVRCVGESWPLSRDRCRIEAEALRLQHGLAPEHVPRVFHFDGGRSLIAMEYVAPPAAVLRHEIVAGRTFPKLAAHVARFLAATLFNTSLYALDSRAFRCGRGGGSGGGAGRGRAAARTGHPWGPSQAALSRRAPQALCPFPAYPTLPCHVPASCPHPTPVPQGSGGQVQQPRPLRAHGAGGLHG